MLEGNKRGTTPGNFREINTIFREPCLRLLLHTLKLRSYNLNYSAARTLLHQSPHLASYFTTLVISLPPTGRALEEVESLQEVLGKLANVRRCILSGNADFYPWDALPPVLASAILECLRRQTLSDLHITTLHNLPIAVFTTLLRAAPTLSFCLSSVTSTVDGLATDHLPTSPVVQNILLTECPSIVDLLESKGFQPHIADVRKLWVEPHSDHSGRILSIFASKLEFILFHSYLLKIDFEKSTLPPLRCVEIPLKYDAAGSTVAAMARVAAALQELRVTYHPIAV
ncbi:hypothetical protein B0H10DRAFT_1961942 [Mycena sp. CBHHK59/15]|nr:hypothetical protein B0H10DRAFT_1961942 [Mycena sp. CBHHK59/15]